MFAKFFKKATKEVKVNEYRITYMDGTVVETDAAGLSMMVVYGDDVDFAKVEKI